MSDTATSRLRKLASHLIGSSSQDTTIPSTPRHNYYHALSPTLFLPRAAAIEPDAIAIVHKTANGKVLRRSYQEFADRARGLAYGLKKHGYKRVGILCTNTPAFLEAMFGIAAAGGVHVGVNYRLKKDDVQYIMTNAEVEMIIVDREFVSLLEGYKTSIPIVVDEDVDFNEGELSGDFDRLVYEGLDYDKKNGNKGWEGLDVEPEDENALLAIPYTSGTTARPKGVEYTHRGSYLAALGNIAESGLNSQHVLGHNRCRYLWTLPMFHATGWTFPWAVTAVRGVHYCLRKIDYEVIWDILINEKITHACFAPTVGTLLTASPKAQKLEQEVRVAVAASPPSASLFKAMIAVNLYPVHVYGLTETYGPLTKGYFMDAWNSLPESEKYERMARQGHGFLTSHPVRVIKTEEPPGTIVDVEKNGKEIGEICFTGNLCGAGYYKDAEATQKLFEGGVLHSGDLAVWHPDGAIQILDRSKDIIISGGENISSIALESMLARHPDILEVGVIGVPDSHWGERCKAYVTVRQGATLKGEEVIHWAKEVSDISRFMVPREVEIVDELPKTSTGKIKKNDLRAMNSKK